MPPENSVEKKGWKNKFRSALKKIRALKFFSKACCQNLLLLLLLFNFQRKNAL